MAESNQKDPFQVPIDEKIDLLLTVNAEALKVDGANIAVHPCYL